MKTALLGLAAIVSACASFDLTPLDSALHSYQGRPAQELFTVIGMPDREIVIAGERGYVWNNGGVHTGLTSSTTSHQGRIGSSPYSGTSTTLTPTTTYLACEVRAFVDDGERIVAMEYDGNQGACAAYANMFRAASASKGPRR